MDLKIFNCRAQWITMSDDSIPAPMFRKDFEISGEIQRIVCKVSGLGSYIMYIDGNRPGDAILEPRFSNYNESVYYNEFEIPALSEGKHTIGIMLGRSRKSMITKNTWGWHSPPWETERMLVFQVDIYYANGTLVCIGSDDTWKYEYGPVRFDCLYAGERYDARFEQPGWNTPDFNDHKWHYAVYADEPKGRLILQESPPIKPSRTIYPETVAQTLKGSVLYSFSENVSGNAAIKAKGKKGDSMILRYGEKISDDQTVDSEYVNIEGGIQVDKYTFSGNNEICHTPLFTYKGFRYIEVITKGDVELLEIKGLVYHNDIMETGTFKSSSDLINRLHENSRRALLSNLHHTPTDTPIYEKNGWTGDAQLTSLVAMFNYNVRSLYGTWMSDFADAQLENGELPPIIPSPGWGYSSSDFGWEDAKPALPAWDVAYFEILRNLNLFYGCPELIAKHYDNLVKYIGYLESCTEGYIVLTGLGDWLAPAGENHSEELLQPNENHLTSTAYYFRMVSILSEFAGILKKQEDAEHYQSLAAGIKNAFNTKYLNPDTGIYSSAEGYPFRQTPNVISLAFSLVPGNLSKKTATALAKDITKTRKGHLWTGIIGTRYILDVLCDYGYADVALTLVQNDTYPSWGYWMNNGATSMYESWELDSRSRNHHMYGTLDSWFYSHLCGINPVKPGFREVLIKPYFPEKLKEASASYITESGELSSAWSRKNGKIEVIVSVPYGITAVFVDTTGQNHDMRLKSGENTFIL